MVARSGGFSAGSSPISWMSDIGSGPVVGEEPVQRTRILEEIGEGSGNFSSGEVTVTVQLLL